MSKTQDELKELKKEYEALNKKLKELSEEELELVTGGAYRKENNADKNAKVIFDVD